MARVGRTRAARDNHTSTGGHETKTRHATSHSRGQHSDHTERRKHRDPRRPEQHAHRPAFSRTDCPSPLAAREGGQAAVPGDGREGVLLDAGPGEWECRWREADAEVRAPSAEERAPTWPGTLPCWPGNAHRLTGLETGRLQVAARALGVPDMPSPVVTPAHLSCAGSVWGIRRDPVLTPGPQFLKSASGSPRLRGRCRGAASSSFPRSALTLGWFLFRSGHRRRCPFR